MYPPTHAFVAFVLAEIGVFFGLLSHQHAILAAILAPAIDIDHLTSYYLKTKKFSLKNVWNSSIKSDGIAVRTRLHGWEGFIGVAILSIIIGFFSAPLAITIAIAYYSHVALDAFEFKHYFYIVRVAGLQVPLYTKEFIMFLVSGIVLVVLL